jgi:hypothetical protein
VAAAGSLAPIMDLRHSPTPRIVAWYSRMRRIVARTRCHRVVSSAIIWGFGFTPSTKPAATNPTTASTTACEAGASPEARYSDVRSRKVCSPSRRCHTNQPAGERRWLVSRLASLRVVMVSPVIVVRWCTSIPRTRRGRSRIRTSSSMRSRACRSSPRTSKRSVRRSTSSVHGSRALTVALRNPSVSRAASPKREPGSSVARVCSSPWAPLASTSTRPLRST